MHFFSSKLCRAGNFWGLQPVSRRLLKANCCQLSVNVFFDANAQINGLIAQDIEWSNVSWCGGMNSVTSFRWQQKMESNTFWRRAEPLSLSWEIWSQSRSWDILSSHFYGSFLIMFALFVLFVSPFSGLFSQHMRDIKFHRSRLWRGTPLLWKDWFHSSYQGL